MDNNNILEFRPRNVKRQTGLRVLTPNDGQRFKPKHDRQLARLSFRWIPSVKSYVSAPPEYSDEDIEAILENEDR